MILVDTSVWIDFFNGTNTPQTQVLDQLLDKELVITGDIILAELLQGFRSDSDFRQARDAMDGLDCYMLAGKEVAIKSAENYRFLRKKGITIRKTTDMIIATFCIMNKIPLLYSDHDFNPMVIHLGLLSAEKPSH
jgi:predicted nucleic acid-binding protein